MKRLRLRLTPPQTFVGASLGLIIALVVALSFVESSFYRQAIIDHEASIVFAMVRAMTLEQESENNLSSWDLRDYTASEAQAHLQHTFKALKNLPDEVLVKVFNPEQTIVWSDGPGLVGTKLTSNRQDLERAIRGEVRVVLNSADLGTRLAKGFKQPVVMEFYVPFTLKDLGPMSNAVSGVVSIYLYQKDVDRAIFQGTLLLTLITGLGGALLFASLYRLFYSVYHKQREAESQFAKLSTEHEHILRIEKLSALGQMVTEIAHQLNNPLVGVVNLAELAEHEAENPQRVRELLRDVRNAGEHCREFVQRMLQFNEVARSEPKPTEMNNLLRETITFFQQSMPGHPKVAFQGPDRPVTLDVDPVLIRHGIFNLIHNASLAEPKGTVTVSLAAEERAGVPGWQIAVSDCGAGIKPEVAAKLFTPFFTTRPKGTGLGLSVAQQIALEHGGSIHGENKPEGGARFVLWLPERR